MQQRLGIAPPYTVEAGASGIKGFQIAAKPPGQGETRFGPFYDDEFKVRIVLNENTDAGRSALLLKIFEGLYRLSGYQLPVDRYGFPPATD